MVPSVWVIVPTYDEAGTIERTVRAVHRELSVAVPDGHRILVVDDGSPDGTGAIAERLGEQLGVVEVLHRRGKEGLGRAYLAGFTHALERGARRICQMDADYSHDPAALPSLLAACEGADVALGSRYVPGGGVADWGPLRRAVSRGGCLYARTILGVAPHDLTGGFKCFRREVLERIELETVRSQGYVFQVEITYRAILAGFRVVEVPIRFCDRTVGTSKMSARIALEAGWRVPLLRRTAPLAVARGTAGQPRASAAG